MLCGISSFIQREKRTRGSSSSEHRLLFGGCGFACGFKVESDPHPNSSGLGAGDVLNLQLISEQSPTGTCSSFDQPPGLHPRG